MLEYIICACIWIGFILHWITGSIPKQLFAYNLISICKSLWFKETKHLLNQYWVKFSPGKIRSNKIFFIVYKV